MSVIKLYNLARMSSATTGTGTLTLGSAVSGYLSFAGAGVSDGDVIYYGIADGTNAECGYGTYTAAGTTLTRNVVKSTNSNSAINCSGSQQVYITAIAGDGGDMLPGTVSPLRGFDTPINLQLNASVATNILTIAVKANNGSDPSNTNPVLIPFRDSTAANGDPVWRAVTAALSINTNAVGATLGTANTVPFRLWVVAFDNGGTVVLALWQSVTGGSTPTAVAPLNESAVATSTAISGAATSAGTFYTPNGTTVTSKSFRILGYVDYASGLTTAGTYASAPTTIQLFGPGIKKPLDIVQIAASALVTTQATTVSTSFADTTTTVAISPSSAPNLIRATASGPMGSSNSTAATHYVLARGTTAFGSEQVLFSAGGQILSAACIEGLDAPGTTSSTTYKVRFKTDNAGTTADYPATSGSGSSQIIVQEIMV